MLTFWVVKHQNVMFFSFIRKCEMLISSFNDFKIKVFPFVKRATNQFFCSWSKKIYPLFKVFLQEKGKRY